MAAEISQTIEVNGMMLERERESQETTEGLLKRCASSEEDGEVNVPKRARHDENSHDEDSQRTRASRSPEPRSAQEHIPEERGKAATQEERKRGKRLFGGLLSTLSQTASNSQQKRRQEIEQRQQERLRKQKAEDDVKAAEKRQHLQEIRLREQIVFDEQVMRNRHSKMLVKARFLQTRSSPRLYYLPWKCTADQEDTIDDQERKAKVRMELEWEDFKVKKEQHIKRYGSTAETEARPLTPHDSEVEEKNNTSIVAVETANVQRNETDGQHNNRQDNRHTNDESGDVVEEGDEDIVIY